LFAITGVSQIFLTVKLKLPIYKSANIINGVGLDERKEQAETGTACETASSSVSYDNTAAAGRQIQIKDYLLHGAENAVPRRHLRQLTGISDRDLRRRIQLERLAGVPILSSTTAGGYYLPSSVADLEHFVRSMQSRAKEIEAVASAVEAGSTEKGHGEMLEISPSIGR